jgi:putative transposase
VLKGYQIFNQHKPHFITFTVVDWVDVFSRKLYADIFIDSVKYCQKEKGLRLYSWCLMTNHVHFLAASGKNDLSGILRDLKKFTSRAILKAIEDNSKESRQEWMMKIFKEHGLNNIRNERYQFWQQKNHPLEVFSLPFAKEKLLYIHNNPVKAGLVSKPEDWRYSSAKNYVYGNDHGLINVEILR